MSMFRDIRRTVHSWREAGGTGDGALKRVEAIVLVTAVMALYHSAAVAIDEGRFLDKPDSPPGISELPVHSPLAVSEFMVAAADSPEKKRAKVPKFRAGKALKDGLNVSGRPADGGADCGTAWTGLLSDPDADVDPCPAGCVRADRLQVKTDTRSAATQYDVEYRCIQEQASGTYQLSPDANAGASTNSVVEPGASMPARSPDLKSTTGLSSRVTPSPVKGPGAIVIPRENCGTYHTGWVDDPEADSYLTRIYRSPFTLPAVV